MTLAPDPDPAAATPPLDHERLDMYAVALEFQALAARLLRLRGAGPLRNQLDRASTSVVLNIAEAVGRQSGPDRLRFFAIARGSATECAAILDIAAARGLLGDQDLRRGREKLVRLVQMLSRLMRPAARRGR